MTLSELFACCLLLRTAKPIGRDDVIRRLVDGVVESGHLHSDDVPAILRTVVGQERLGSTGIGRGAANST